MAKRPTPTGQNEPKRPDSPSKKKQEGEKIIVENRKARHDYHILETLETGMVLMGTEVKSLRESKVVVQDAYAAVKNGELFLYNAAIQPYAHGNVHNHEERRARKLLAHRREIERLEGKVAEKGLTLVVLKLYFKNGRAKALLGLGKGKKEYDRRDTIKKRESDREAQRAMRRSR